MKGSEKKRGENTWKKKNLIKKRDILHNTKKIREIQ